MCRVLKVKRRSNNTREGFGPPFRSKSMFEFICRVYVLLAGVFGTKETRKRIMYSWSYGMSWQKIAKKIWNKEDGITTMKPSGTVSTLSKEGSGIEPPYARLFYRTRGEAIRPPCKWVHGCVDCSQCNVAGKCLSLDPIDRTGNSTPTATHCSHRNLWDECPVCCH